MESSTWCTRRLGGSVAALSEESTAKFRPTSCCLSINATPVVDGRSSGASSVPGTTCCPTAVTSVTDTDSVLRHCHYSPGSVTASPDRELYRHDHDHVHVHAGRIVSLSSSDQKRDSARCDLCERLRGRSCDYSRTALEEDERGRDTKKEERLERGGMTTRRGQQQPRHVPLAEHAARVTSRRISRRDRPMSDDSSSSYVASVVRWSGSRLGSSFCWTRQKRASAWTILFLLVLVFPASADLQKQTTSRDSTKEEGGY